MIRKILNLANQENELVGIRTSSMDFDEVIIGYVLSINEHSFELNEIDEYATLVGKTAIRFDDVLCLTYKDRYQKRLEFLIKTIHSVNTGEQLLFYGFGKELEAHLKDLLKKKKIATFYFEDDHFVVGILTDLNDEYMMIQNIGIEGDEDGISCYLIDDLSGLRYNGFNEQKIDLFYNAFNEQNSDV